MIAFEEYKLAEPDGIETPALLVFDHLIDHNIATLGEAAGGSGRLMPHVKTHKSEAVARRQLDAGVAGFKCATLKELEMVLDAGAREAVLSYPQVQRRKVERFAELAAGHPATTVHAIVSREQHIHVLAAVAQERSQTMRAMIDLDVGQHRTGVAVGDAAVTLYRDLAHTSHLEASGFHVYDGHEHFSDPTQREAAANRHIADIDKLKAAITAEGLTVDRIVAGSTFSYSYYARTDGMYGSPGTGIYWDAGYAGSLPDVDLRFAALVLNQVVDCQPAQKTFTTDLGYKAIAGDPPLARRARLLGHPEAQLAMQNEEHGVFASNEPLPEVGTYLLAIPGHICPTTVRYPGSYVIDTEGQIVDYYPHSARDRL